MYLGRVRTIPTLVAKRRAELVSAIEARLKRRENHGEPSAEPRTLDVGQWLDVVAGEARVRRLLGANGDGAPARWRSASELARTLEELTLVRRVVGELCFDLDPSARPSRGEWAHFARRIEYAMRCVSERFEREAEQQREEHAALFEALDGMRDCSEIDGPFPHALVEEVGRRWLEEMRRTLGAAVVVFRVESAGERELLCDVALGEQVGGLRPLLVDAIGDRPMRGASPRAAATSSRWIRMRSLPSEARAAGLRTAWELRFQPSPRVTGAFILGWMSDERVESERLKLGAERVVRFSRQLDEVWYGRALKRRVDQLAAEQELRLRFVASLVHDLRGPLATAKLGSQLLQRGRSNAEGRDEATERIVRNLDRIDGMLRDLLDVSRVEAGKPLPLELRPCDLKVVAEEVVRDLSALHGSRFTLEVASPVRGVWSASELRRALWNLCVNAVRYGSPDSQVIVRVDDRGESVELSVHNDGEPIAQAEQVSLFDGYLRGKQAVPVEGSWGLGLAVVRVCAEAHGGRASVVSHEQEGTTFSLTLPRDARPHQARTTQMSSWIPSSTT